ncbi:hypothetical protein F4776DRAFT_423893 [Hypoxylon sp. NC0597]|nr:hypothetical protein F4776DRAFT_423893 [Hypoxylon sp. NC0597]
MTNTPLHAKILSIPAALQDESPLFGVLPAEIRTFIFSLALTDYPDPTPDKQYAAETCYTRPHYFAPRKTDTALLRTCRAAYAECWFLPFVLQEQVHWLTAQDRAPPEYRVHASRQTLRSRLQQIREQRGGDEIVEIEGLRVFAQMYKLEGGQLATLLRTPGLYPRRLTLTIRHTDWWNWEEDLPLRFEARWIETVSDVLPSSVREFCIELESLERKKDQVDSIAKQMREKWFFKRTDGAALFPDVTGGNVEVSRWSGTSTWHGQTWTRDETAPGRIDYYVVCVPFRLQHVVERKGGAVSDEASRAASRNIFNAHKMRLFTTRNTTRTVASMMSIAAAPHA